jgi:hypothetical protein
VSRPLSSSVIRAAERARKHPFFLASVLEEYRQMNGMNSEEVAQFLGCSWEDLVRLALCRCPITDSPTFLKDVDYLARRFAFPSERLIQIIREINSIRALRDHFNTVQEKKHLLMAARDREDDATDEVCDHE